MSASSIPGAKAALLTRLAARPGLAGVQIEWGHPGKNIRAEAIYLGDVTIGQRGAALGAKRREEEYGLEVVVSVLRKGNDPRGTEERMWALVAEIENDLRDDHALGGAYLAQVGDINPDTFPGPQQVIAEATVRVDCKARL